jgi:dTDP-4-dehydrorhamnose reductase
MRILITGAGGLLGLNLSLDLLSSHQVIGVDRCTLSRVPFELLSLDLLDEGVLESLLASVKPDLIIHCAAMANVDACELNPSASFRINARLPEELAILCAQHHIGMIHISTDAVFDGTREGYYTETDEPNPLGIYAQTKLEAEQAILKVNPAALVARVNFFGWSLNGKRSLAEFFVNNLKAGIPIQGFTDVFFCPMFVGDLADTLLEMLEKELSGLYHVVGSQAISKYDFGVAIAHKFGYEAGLIQPGSVEESSLKARRSHNLRLSVHRLSTDLGKPVPGFSNGLAGFYTQALQGYPQKIATYQQDPAHG